MKTTRRHFLNGCTAGLAAVASSRLTGFVFAADTAAPPKQILLVISLRGGLDSLNVVAPAGDKDLVAARSEELRVAEGGENKGRPLGRLGNTDFLLHPSAEPLMDLYKEKHLAIVHACGLTNGTRSHFEAMDLMERGVADMKDKKLATGWLARYLALGKTHATLPGVALGGGLPTSLLGSKWAYALPSPRDFGLSMGDDFEPLMRRIYEGNSATQASGQSALTALAAVRAKLPKDENGNPAEYQPAGGSEYPETSFAESLKSVAELLKMDIGLEVATADLDGFDTHENQNSVLPGLLDDFSRSLTAFWNDVHDFHKRLTVIVVSEFGRRLKANDSAGTDHGLGGAVFVLGGSIKGGRLCGSWPGLATENLDDGADLAVTTDYRAVLAEILARSLTGDQVRSVLPGFSPGKSLGLLA
jgi:uncharacterized protein (DUF1501 family)